jgi:hypothetical protein
VVDRPRRFQQLSIVRLRAPEPQDGPDDDRIQQEHLAYLRGLQDRGLILVNGPVRPADDQRFRGMTICRARRRGPPALAGRPGRTGRLVRPHVDGWLIPAEAVALGARVDVELPAE